MANQVKAGLDYFSHDVDILQDKKIKLIKAKHGLIGYAIYLRLLEELYRDKGYYLQIDDNFNILFSDENNIDKNVYINILNDCINFELFNKKIYEKYTILTSKRIQQNYCKATKRRKEIEIIEEYLLLNIDDVNILNENVNIIQIDVNINTSNDNINSQSKVKESKVKESKEYIVDHWNSKDNLIGVRKLNKTRNKKLNLRLKEFSVDDFKLAIDKASDSKFCTGQTDNKWNITFDWLIKNNDNILKVLEGNYDDKEAKSGGTKKDSGENEKKSLFETRDEWKDKPLPDSPW